jgi:hypothetical protein
VIDKEIEELNKFKEVSIGFHWSEAKGWDDYCARMSLYSGGAKKYSVSYVTCREERFLSRFTNIWEKLGQEVPEALTKLIEVCAKEDVTDEDKKPIYDESFAAIKNERYAFKLPKGVKR